MKVDLCMLIHKGCVTIRVYVILNTMQTSKCHCWPMSNHLAKAMNIHTRVCLCVCVCVRVCIRGGHGQGKGTGSDSPRQSTKPARGIHTCVQVCVHFLQQCILIGFVKINRFTISNEETHLSCCTWRESDSCCRRHKIISSCRGGRDLLTVKMAKYDSQHDNQD